MNEKVINFHDILMGVDSKVEILGGVKIRAVNFDNAATTPPFKCVLDSIINLSEYYGSIGRGAGQKAEVTTRIYNETREYLLDFFNIKDKEKYTVIYVNNATDGINTLARVLIKDKNEFNFTWITEFPLFEYNEEEDRYHAAHHPFTSPMDEDLEFVESDPARVRAKAYDLVLNGEELGGGSIRIHDSAIQERMLKALGFTEERAWESFGFLLQALKFGAPPHGGLAFGLDRMIMFLAGTENIKDVIAFPKNQNAFCYLSEAPNVVDEKQIEELGLVIDKKEEE